ncbi:MAG: hypothetical protein JXJ04_05230 [Spirochaetales bacterium]|nr:hypothetical protein [Spirochaetales bacterium]
MIGSREHLSLLEKYKTIQNLSEKDMNAVLTAETAINYRLSGNPDETHTALLSVGDVSFAIDPGDLYRFHPLRLIDGDPATMFVTGEHYQ